MLKTTPIKCDIFLQLQRSKTWRSAFAAVQFGNFSARDIIVAKSTSDSTKRCNYASRILNYSKFPRVPIFSLSRVCNKTAIFFSVQLHLDHIQHVGPRPLH